MKKTHSESAAPPTAPAGTTRTTILVLRTCAADGGSYNGFKHPVEPGTFPLVNGATARVGKLRAYGNAICAPLAAEFIRAALEAIMSGEGSC